MVWITFQRGSSSSTWRWVRRVRTEEDSVTDSGVRWDYNNGNCLS